MTPFPPTTSVREGDDEDISSLLSPLFRHGILHFIFQEACPCPFQHLRLPRAMVVVVAELTFSSLPILI